VRDLVLVVDDNDDIRAFVRLSLESQDFRVIEAVNALEAMVKLVNEKPNLIILDIGIGQPDGLEVCREVRKHSEVPIIMLTVRDDEIDEAMCLAAGANDYLTKPVSKTILGLRVANQLRTKKDVESQAPTVLKAAELSLDLLTRELRVNETVVPITRTEFDFIHLLMEEPNRVFTRAQVSQAIGISAEFTSDHLLDTHASRLRIKILNAGGPRAISAVRAVGYRLI
jgi:two-component system OmpR family response regulator